MEVAATIGASFTNLRVTNGFRRKARIIERVWLGERGSENSWSWTGERQLRPPLEHHSEDFGVWKQEREEKETVWVKWGLLWPGSLKGHDRYVCVCWNQWMQSEGIQPILWHVCICVRVTVDLFSFFLFLVSQSQRKALLGRLCFWGFLKREYMQCDFTAVRECQGFCGRRYELQVLSNEWFGHCLLN